MSEFDIESEYALANTTQLFKPKFGSRSRESNITPTKHTASSSGSGVIKNGLQTEISAQIKYQQIEDISDNKFFDSLDDFVFPDEMDLVGKEAFNINTESGLSTRLDNIEEEPKENGHIQDHPNLPNKDVNDTIQEASASCQKIFQNIKNVVSEFEQFKTKISENLNQKKHKCKAELDDYEKGYVQTKSKYFDFKEGISFKRYKKQPQ